MNTAHLKAFGIRRFISEEWGLMLAFTTRFKLEELDIIPVRRDTLPAYSWYLWCDLSWTLADVTWDLLENPPSNFPRNSSSKSAQIRWYLCYSPQQQQHPFHTKFSHHIFSSITSQTPYSNPFPLPSPEIPSKLNSHIRHHLFSAPWYCWRCTNLDGPHWTIPPLSSSLVWLIVLGYLALE